MASTYLVALFCASAGRNGEDLGADEEQIVLFVILLFDVTNNKVVALQSHFVKPQPNELSESLLTEDCKTETGLDENVIKNGQPLDQVLEELDRFLVAKGVHPDHGGKSFSFVTDGQCHLRQLLHPEACTKNINLPSYFCRFFDLRKEFKKFYKTDTIKNIKEMLDYLGLAEDQSVEYGVRQCQEMASILHRLVNDGNVFLEPEIINERLEPGICSKNEYVDDNSVVRSRGLPWQSSDQDIARFFKGLNIAKGGVALCLSPQGRRNGEALVRFESNEHRDLALRRHKHHIGQRYIEVYKATGKDFVNVAGGSNSEAQAFLSRGGQVIIRMRGLPFTATSQQVLEFFAREPNSCDVLDGEDGTLFVHYPDGRSTGDAFVLFASEEEANKGLKKHRDTMGARYIELFKSTTAEVQQVLNRSMDPRNPEQPDGQLPLIASLPQQTAQVPIIPQNLITSGTRKDCIRLRNIPAGAQVTDILTFLGEYSQFIVYQGVHMVYTAQGEPSGEAFIQMDTEESSTHTTLNRHRRQMVFANKKRIIDVIQCSGDDMSLVLTSGMPVTQLPQPGPAPTIQRPILTPGLAEFPMRHIPQFSLIDQTITGMKVSTTILPSPSLGGLPFAQLPQPIPAGFPPTLTQIPQRPASFYPPILYWYPSPPVSPQTYITHMGPSVVVMRGLPINVTVQDIMAYFQGFSEVTADTVQLQTGGDGKPTGDALITFSSRAEAERAIMERNRRHLGNRFIELFMVS